MSLMETENYLITLRKLMTSCFSPISHLFSLLFWRPSILFIPLYLFPSHTLNIYFIHVFHPFISILFILTFLLLTLIPFFQPPFDIPSSTFQYNIHLKCNVQTFFALLLNFRFYLKMHYENNRFIKKCLIIFQAFMVKCCHNHHVKNRSFLFIYFWKTNSMALLSQKKSEFKDPVFTYFCTLGLYIKMISSNK